MRFLSILTVIVMSLTFGCTKKEPKEEVKPETPVVKTTKDASPVKAPVIKDATPVKSKASTKDAPSVKITPK